MLYVYSKAKPVVLDFIEKVYEVRDGYRAAEAAKRKPMKVKSEETPVEKKPLLEKVKLEPVISEKILTPKIENKPNGAQSEKTLAKKQGEADA